MLTSDTAAIFPACPTYGFTSSPRYLVKKIMREGGFERRNRKWARPLHSYSAVPTGDRPQADIEAVRDFWHAMGGEELCFRFKDYVDFKSCGLAATPLATDQPLIPTDDSPASFQLVRQYIVGARIQEREITRPIGSTILIANEFGALQAGSHWQLDESTGKLVTLAGFTGTPTSWGGEYHVWVRFDGDASFTVSNFEAQNAQFMLTEQRDRGNAENSDSP